MEAAGTTQSAAASVDEFFNGAFALLQTWQHQLARDLANQQRSAELTSAGVDLLVHPYAMQTLGQQSIPVYGAGFIAAEQLLSDSTSHLSWWQGPRHERLDASRPFLNTRPLTYSNCEWYRVPRRTGLPHLTGPSVDHICSDEYMITISAPVTIGDAFVGVSALDLLADTVERRLLPILRGAGGRSALANRAGRIIATTDALLAPGDPVDESWLADGERCECGGGMTLLLD